MRKVTIYDWEMRDLDKFEQMGYIREELEANGFDMEKPYDVKPNYREYCTVYIQ